MKLKYLILAASFIVSVTLIATGCQTGKDAGAYKKINYPTKTIRLISYASVGSPPDIVNRKFVQILQQKYGWHFDIVNADANFGSDAVKQVWNAPHDGYTILGQSENVLSLPVRGLTLQTSKDWTYFEIMQDATVLVVNSKSHNSSLESLMAAAKSEPGSIKVACGSEGRTFHLKAKALENVAGVQFQYLFYNGADKAAEAVLNGQADAASVSVSQSKKYISDKKLKPLAILDLGAYDFGGSTKKIESIINYYPDYKTYMPLDAVIGLAMPADVPKDIIEKFGKAFEEIMDSKEMDDLIASRDNIKVGLWSNNAQKYMSEMESSYSWLLRDNGLSKIDPNKLGIPKP